MYCRLQDFVFSIESERMLNRIKQLAEKYQADVVRFRRHLHSHPELSFEEKHTSDFIKSILKAHDITFTDGLGGGTGIIGEIGKGKKVIALRADIDALPIQETNDVSYKSQYDQVMHACGHDVHSASLLGTLLILKSVEKELNGQVRFIFQPGEERLPGGASLLIKDGALVNPKVEAIYGQHVHPSLSVGKVGIKAEHFMASCDEIFITVLGKGGHGAMPQDTIDPVLTSAEIIQSLQSIISRAGHPNIPSVLTIGKINSEGGATNVIPDKVMMEGTFRTFDEKWRGRAHELIKKRVEHIAAAHGAQVEVNILKGYPSLFNDPALTAHAHTCMVEYLGKNNVVELPSRMTAEDFSYYSQVVPACFYRLGTSAADGRYSSPVHTSTFDIDESALLYGSGLMAWLAYQTLADF